MSRRTIGIIASLVGSAVGAWYYARQRAAAHAARHLTPARERGTVILDNTPPASPDAPL